MDWEGQILRGIFRGSLFFVLEFGLTVMFRLEVCVLSLGMKLRSFDCPGFNLVITETT